MFKITLLFGIFYLSSSWNILLVFVNRYWGHTEMSGFFLTVTKYVHTIQSSGVKYRKVDPLCRLLHCHRMQSSQGFCFNDHIIKIT